MRKIIIGLIAVGFVASLFWAYARIMDAKPIEVHTEEGADDQQMPESDEAVRQAGGADVRVAKEARYVVLDPETEEVTRVFGFDNLLNPGMDTSRREVEKPYMIFYESDYQCRINADMGMFQVETSGSNSTPKDARLNGNVKIHIAPKPGSKISETVVEMDDLVFSSERSEFATDQRVYIKSEKVELKGTGLIVIFDPASGRIDFLRIRDLDQIRMQGLTDSKPEMKTAKATPAKESATQAKPASDSVAVSEKDDDGDGKVTEEVRYYQCLLEDNVKITHGNEIVVAAADQVNIQNISFDQNTGTDKTPEKAASEPEKTAKSNEPSEKNPERDVESISEVIVTCDGGIILKPMEDAEQLPDVQSALPMEMTLLRTAKIIPSVQHSPTVERVNFIGDIAAKSKTADNAAPKEDSEPNDAPPTKFEARKLDYDLLTGSGLAHGPVRFTFYQAPDANSPAPKVWVPITVTADEEARFIADSAQTIKQVVFNANVMTTRESRTPDFVQVDNLHSDKLTIDLDEVEDGTVDLGRLRMTEGKVYVESKRIQENRELSIVKLYCTEISYDRIGDVILAQGPGKIELVNNERSQMAGSDPNNPMNQPCVAVVDSFSTIRWDMAKQSIIADGEQDAMKLAYYPIVDGQIQKQLFVYSMQLELSYLPDAAGIEKVFTDKSIIYEEWNSDMTKRLHHIVGQTLDYDASEEDGWMKISGTPAVPCSVDGARMQEVLVNPLTGEIKASISTRPGILKGR